MTLQSAPDVAASADARGRGNDWYRQGNMTLAETAYQEAMALAPDDPLPYSNLAAVYSELGQYAKCAKLCRESLARVDQDAQQSLRDKNYLRLAKALLFSNKFDESSAVLSEVTSEDTRKGLQASLSRVSHIPSSKERRDTTRKKLLDNVPRYKPSLQNEPEHYSVGHDDTATVIPEDLLSTSQPDIACLLGGIGDARNLLATIFFTDLLELSPQVALGNRRSYHFTLVDLKPAVFARDLLIFRLLFELAIVSRQGPTAAEEIEVTLSYLFAAQVMPQWVSDQLQACISVVLEDLRDSTRNVLGVFYIPEPVRERIIRVLLQWKQTPESWYTARSLRRTAATRKALGDYFDSVWQPNVTMVDLDWERKRGDGPAPHMGFTPDDVVRDLFVNIPAHLLKRGPGLLDHLRGFFWLISPPLAMMQPRLVVEIVIGEMVDAFERLRYGLLRQDWKAVQKLDPAKFPRVYDSIDMSNIPDYIGGPLTTFLHGLPLLREQRASRMRSYVIRNTPIWKTHSAFLAEHLLLPKREQITSHFRTALKSHSLETEQDNSGRIVNGGGVVMAAGYEWEPTSSPTAQLAPETRMTRGELERWLHSHFLKLCLPFPGVPGDLLLIYAPLGMASYFSLVSHVATLGYPAHWLAGLLATLCRGVLARSRAGPPTAEVTNERMAARLWPVKDVCTAPFVAEFRTLLAMWEPLLGFSMVDANSDELLLPQREAIRRYTIQLPDRRDVTHLSTSAFVLVLKARSCEVAGGNLRRLLDDRTGDSSPAACTARMSPRVHVVSAFTWKADTTTAGFWMDKGVMDSLIADGSWEAWIWRTDTWRAVLGPAPLHGDGVSVGESWR